MNKLIQVSFPPSPPDKYPIHIGQNLLKDLPALIPQELKNHAFVIITDNKVKKLYGEALCKQLNKQGLKTELFSFAAGEKNKTLETKAKLQSALFKKSYGRDTCILALGGGVVGDLAGFLASTYMRGVPYIQIPTTLMAMIDSSIGGKTAINAPEGKNLIGAFYQPRAVITDLNCLKTLGDKQITSGWIEILKIFLTCDRGAFHEAIKTNAPNEMWIQRAIQMKANIVKQDPKDSGIRNILNFGHTIGHALEKISDYKLLHGFAVAYGILLESLISYRAGLIQKSDLDLIHSSLATLGFKSSYFKKIDLKALLAATKLDKKAKGKDIRYVLLNGIGGHQIKTLTDNDVSEAFEELVHAG